MIEVLFRRSPRLQGVPPPPRPQTGQSTLLEETHCTLLPLTLSQALFWSMQIIGRPAALDWSAPQSDQRAPRPKPRSADTSGPSPSAPGLPHAPGETQSAGDQTEKQGIGTKNSSRSKSSAAHRCVTDPPPPYTLGTCGTCNAAESGTKKTTVFSAGPPYTPKRGQTRTIKECLPDIWKHKLTSDTIKNQETPRLPLLDCSRHYRVSPVALCLAYCKASWFSCCRLSHWAAL